MLPVGVELGVLCIVVLLTLCIVVLVDIAKAQKEYITILQLLKFNLHNIFDGFD